MRKETWGGGILRERWDTADGKYERFNAQGVRDAFRDLTAQEVAVLTPPVDVVNTDAVLSKFSTMISTNATFLGIPSPSNAQNAAQIKALTRQVNALLRLRGGSLTDVSDT